MAELAATAVAAFTSFVSSSSLAAPLLATSTILSAGGAVAAGRAAQTGSEFEARQLEQQGKTEFAVAAKQAEQLRREKQLAMSRARAVGADSGGGVDLGVMQDLEATGELNALSALWEGREARAGRRVQATSSRMEGRMMKQAGYLRGIDSILSGSYSMYDKYGRA